MNIKNDQIIRLANAIDLLADKAITPKERAVIKKARAVFDELEVERTRLNARTCAFMSGKRNNDPLYGRSTEYKKARLEKAKRIIELYGKEREVK